MTNSDGIFRAMHDLAGTEAEAFEPTGHEPSDFERRVDVLVNLLAAREINLVCPDERRRGIEELTLAEYRSFTYYQRWLHGVTRVLLQKGVLDRVGLEAKLAEIRDREL